MHCEQEDAALAALEEQMEAQERNDEREALLERKKEITARIPETIKYIAPSIHPVALIEPWIYDDIVSLVFDFELRGQLVPCYELAGEAAECFGKGKFGKHRIAAAILAGIDCWIEEIDEIPGGSLLDWNNAHNNVRRHLDKGQRINVYKGYKARYKWEADLISKHNLKKGSENPRSGQFNQIGQNAQDRPVDAKSEKKTPPKSSRKKAAEQAGITESEARRSDALEAKCRKASRMDLYERTMLPEKDPQYLTITAAGRLLKEEKPANKTSKKAAKKSAPKTLEDCIKELLAMQFEDLERWKQPSDWRTLAPKGLKDILANARNLSFSLKSWQDPGRCPVCKGKGLEGTGSDGQGVKAHCTHCGGRGQAGKQWKPIDN
jgi:hypothetical protein